jgi:hypothetical protein
MADLKVVQEFVKGLLQWDYAAMFEKHQAGEGLVEDLPQVPKTFKDIEVRLLRCSSTFEHA